MNDTELYERVLGLSEPWFVEGVELSVKPQRADIHLSHREGVKWACPTCSKELACHDHVEERTWRHLDTCQFQTHLHARIPRVRCPEHGVVQVRVPWAEPHGRFTLLFERLIIDVLRVTHTISGACALLGITWDEGMAVMQRGVKRGQERKAAAPPKVARIGVDEKAFRRGHSYMTIVCNLDTSTIEYVAEDRKTSSLSEYFQSLTDEELAGIEALAPPEVDMWEPYVAATMEHVPLAGQKIVFDRFHIMKLMNEAVDKVRRSEHRELKSEGDDTLTGSKHWWLYGKENVPAKSRAAFRALRDQESKTGRAWSIKETLRGLWGYKSTGWARRFFNQWFGWARRSGLEPVKKAALTLKRHLANILTYCVHGITNAVSEGLNSRIMAIKRISSGRRNKENFKTAIISSTAV